MAECICNTYRRNKDLYHDAVKSGDLKLDSVSNEDYVETAFLSCTKCSKKWKFTRDDSYHEPIVEWKTV